MCRERWGEKERKVHNIGGSQEIEEEEKMEGEQKVKGEEPKK